MMNRTPLLAFVVAALCLGTDAAATAADEYAAAAALGVFRNEGFNMVSIDFDVPRYGPLCINVDEGATLKIAWEEYHNLYTFTNETAFANCDFSAARAVMSEGMPRPDGITFAVLAETAVEQGNVIINAPSYYACSKICASNGHKVKVCRGGNFGEATECSPETTQCSSERTIDVRSSPEAMETSVGSRDYLPVGKVCRPKNGDGYYTSSGLDTPESCQKKCDDEASKCGAWEFEDHDLDNMECELHEMSAVSYEETLAMGDCEIAQAIGDADYRCCWIAKEVVEAQTEKVLEIKDNGAFSDSGAPANEKRIVLFLTISTILTLLASGI